jgi:methylated-DNA-[protein]-cysteine S-methyltransferase
MERTGRTVFSTPFGWAGVAVTGKGIAHVILPRKNRRKVEREIRDAQAAPAADAKLLRNTVKMLQRYFSGTYASFDLPLDLRYHTTFQQAVWKATAEIPFGETRSYGWVAKRIKNPKAVRAVGQALGANPIPIIIP